MASRRGPWEGDRDEREGARSVGVSGVEGAELGKYVNGCGGYASKAMLRILCQEIKKGAPPCVSEHN